MSSFSAPTTNGTSRSTNHETEECPRVRVLTVGDGDLSFSLALISCCTVQALDLTISTCAPSWEVLQSQHATAASNVCALKALYVAAVKEERPRILYGIDACALHTPEARQRLSTSNNQNDVDDTKLFDLVFFQYPHVGVDTSVSEDVLRHRNISLLHSYLYSAAHIAKYVLVTLNPNQSRSWRLYENDVFPEPPRVVPIQVPISRVFPAPWDNRLPIPPPPSMQKTKRGARAAQRHFLHAYGYRHVRTLHNAAAETIHLTGSCHYIFTAPSRVLSPRCIPEESWRASPRTPSDEPEGTSIPTRRHEGTSPFKVPEEEEEEEECPLQNNSASDTTDTAQDVCYTEYPVTEEHVGKRLRCFLQHVVHAQPCSKRTWERYIKNGAVSINQEIVTDSARILQAPDWRVATRIPRVSERTPDLAIAATWTTPTTQPPHFLWVVYKPVGMRTRGPAATLEAGGARQLGRAVRCLSTLDKGCRGWCVLQPVEAAPRVIRHIFCALVYGHVPVSWQSGIGIVLPLDGVRRWRKKRRAAPRDSSEEEKDDALGAPPPIVEDGRAILTLVERTTAAPHLSTVTVSTTARASGLAQTIAFFLRHQKYPVVGDRMAAQEYLSLPRAIRNRLKQRWCLGCIGVALEEDPDQYCHHGPVPDPWSARHWENFVQHSNANNRNEIE